MFKFMKSKKGFTLVELMIVVVIMAILVAVAVPIFSAVTKNARAKTCVSNMREIVSQLTNKAMSEGLNYTGNLSYAPDANDSSKAGNITGSITAGSSTIDGDAFDKMFQAGAPVCPAGGTYKIVMSATGAGDANGSVAVTITCANNTDSATNHVYGATSN